MKSSLPLPPRNSLSRKLAGSAALLISIGIVTLIAARSGAAGCVSSADIAAEDPSSAEAPSSTAPWADKEDDIRFMGGAKAPAGNWAIPPKPKSSPDPSAQPSGAPQSPPSGAPQSPPPQAPSPQAPR